jgi:lambda family phage portal protein
MNNFYGLQALVMRHLFTDGEVLVRKVPRASGMKLSVPMQIQVLEADFLDLHKELERMDNGDFIVQGVQFNAQGKKVGYWLYDRHPGEMGTITMKGSNSRFVPADEMLHLFRVDRAGQVRGVTWFAPIMIRMKDYSDFSDATLLRQKLAACFTAFVTTPEGTTGLDDTETPALGEKLEPGIIEVLKQGQSIEFANPPTSGDFSTFTREQIRAMAKGIGVSYEVLSNDYSQVNFSSGRMGWIEFQRNIDQWRWHLLIPHFCLPVWGWFTEAAALVGMGTDPVSSRWTPPKRDMIDPDKEIGASLKQVRAGMKSLSAAIREQGEEPNEVLTQMAEDNKTLDKLGLILDSDPRRTNEFGAPYDLNALKEESKPAAPAAEPQKKSEPAPIAERFFQDQEGTLFKVTENGIEKIT